MPSERLLPIDRWKLVAAYAEMFERRILEGWNPTLLTFMFKPVRGQASRVAFMEKEIERIYHVLLTRQFRNPERELRCIFPFWLAAPDLPVFKHEKAAFTDVVTNKGLHYHAVAAVAPHGRQSWMRESGGHLSQFIERNQAMFAGPNRPLTRLHAVPIERDPGYVVEYGMKSVLRFRFDTDDVLVLPRASSEKSRLTKVER